MVRHMSEGRVARYKERAVADMRMNKRNYIRCPCRTCKLGSLMDPYSADLESHLHTRGFMPDYYSEDDEDVMSTHASILVDSVGPPRVEVCRTAACFP